MPSSCVALTLYYQTPPVTNYVSRIRDWIFGDKFSMGKKNVGTIIIFLCCCVNERVKLHHKGGSTTICDKEARKKFCQRPLSKSTVQM